MVRLNFLARLRHHSRWLLLLAMLLPLAQAAAACHLLSHGLRQQTRATDEQQAVQQAECASCVAAAALGGAAAATRSQALAQFPRAANPPGRTCSGVVPGPCAKGYQSRAPPVALV